MKRLLNTILLTAAISLALAGVANATPSTQIWIPSTDIQAYKTLHLGIDDYIRVKADTATGAYWPIVYDAGLTVGVLPYEKVQMEIGIDYIRGLGTAYDNRPVFFNAKLGTPEGSLFKGSPALAVGAYNLGVSKKTNLALGYALAAKTIPVVGRISAGWYVGNAALLKDQDGNNDNNGVLVSWDRTISEIDDRLWAGIDYQGGNNGFGALNFGVSWAFAKNVSLIVGYDIYTRKATGGQPTFTTQLDINFP